LIQGSRKMVVYEERPKSGDEGYVGRGYDSRPAKKNELEARVRKREVGECVSGCLDVWMCVYVIEGCVCVCHWFSVRVLRLIVRLTSESNAGTGKPHKATPPTHKNFNYAYKLFHMC
jgi:hypothetical protein